MFKYFRVYDLNIMVNEKPIIPGAEELIFKKWDHLPIRPSTFAEFRVLKSSYKFPEGVLESDNAFVVELLRTYKLYLKFKERKAQ